MPPEATRVSLLQYGFAPPRRRHRVFYRIDSPDPLPEGFYEFLFRVGAALIAVLTAAAIAATMGVLNGWQFDRWTLGVQCVVITAVVIASEKIRASVFTERRARIRREKDRAAVEELLANLPLSGESVGRVEASTREPASLFIFNRVLATLLLMLLLPVFALISLLVKLSSSGPVFQPRLRVGRHGRMFLQLCFRTRAINPLTTREHRGGVYGHMTEVGRWLRITGLEELPQLLNVIRGEMNLVGPIPEPPETFRANMQQIPEYRLRTVVRPGMTGPAQVFFAGSAMDRLLFDVQYILRRSVWEDLKLLLMTVSAALVATERIGHRSVR